MKIAAIVVVYHPEIKSLIKNIQSYIDYVDKLLVWRNSDEDLSILNTLSDKILLLGTGKNQYLALPYNSGLDWCYKNEYDFLLTMDQDSLWINFQGFLQRAISYKTREIAVFSPNVNDNENKQFPLIDKETVISSGMLIDVLAAKLVGGFNEKYQIYWVDGEFCFKLRTKGYLIKLITDFPLIHELGKQSKTSFGFTTSNYSAIVYYFLVRNMIWEHREYGEKAVSLKCIAYTLLYNLRGIILGEKNKIKKLVKISKGLIHGCFKPYK